MAVGAVRAALDAGLGIPHDIAIVGYDNLQYSSFLQIPLTSVDQWTSQLGEAAAQLALALVEKKIDSPREILLAPTLVVGESTATKRPAARRARAAKKRTRE